MLSDRVEPWQFEPYARLVTLLGEQLIEDETIALFELAKNAYDADASIVSIALEGEPIGQDGAAQSSREEAKLPRLSSGPPGEAFRVTRITVEDDGHGMTREELREGWMRLGMSKKALADRDGRRRQSFTRSGRRVQLGEKGVGRFAAAWPETYMDEQTGMLRGLLQEEDR